MADSFFVIAASPLAKAFIPDWKDRLQEKPDLLFDDAEPFSLLIKRTSGGIKLEFNKPVHVASLIPKGSEKDHRVLFDWLTGGDDGMRCQETNIYGIVAYEAGFDPVKELSALAALDSLDDDPKAMKKLLARHKELKAQMGNSKEIARAKADQRVLRHMRFTHNNLIKQWQENEENKLGKYPPSMTEMLGAHALSKEIEKANEKSAKLKSRMNDLMANQVV